MNILLIYLLFNMNFFIYYPWVYDLWIYYYSFVNVIDILLVSSLFIDWLSSISFIIYYELMSLFISLLCIDFIIINCLLIMNLRID